MYCVGSTKTVNSAKRGPLPSWEPVEEMLPTATNVARNLFLITVSDN